MGLCVALTTLTATTSTRVKIRQFESAWGRYQPSDIDDYLRAIAEVAEQGGDSGRYDCIVLTQASMSPAVALIKASAPPILSSSAASLRQGLARMLLLRGD